MAPVRPPANQGPPPHVRRRALKRHLAVQALGYRDYTHYLAGPYWHALRERYRAATDLPQACVCGDPVVQLHHKTYERIGRERLTDLTPLCPTCHKLVHVLEARGDLPLDLTGLTDEQRGAENRAALQAIANERANETYLDELADRERLATLPLHERVAELQARAKEQKLDISGDLFIIRQRLAKMQTRVEKRATPRDIEVIAARIDRLEDRLVTPQHRRLRHAA